MPAKPPPISSARDPKAGCLIMLIIASIVTGLIVITIRTPFKQSHMMDDFTEQTPAEIATKEPYQSVPSELQTHLSTIANTLQKGEQSVITFTSAQLNDAIRSFQEFNDLRGKMEVKEITPDEMLFNIAFPLRGRPFSEETPYLNGTLYALPEIMNDEIILNVLKVESSTGEVPEGFLHHLRPYRIMARYSEHELIGRVMYGATKVKLGSDTLHITVNHAKYADPQAVIGDEKEKQKKKKRSTMTTITSFLMVGGLFAFLVKRRNNRNAKAMSNMK